LKRCLNRLSNSKKKIRNVVNLSTLKTRPMEFMKPPRDSSKNLEVKFPLTLPNKSKKLWMNWVNSKIKICSPLSCRQSKMP
jgi:hypothetical protein